LDVHPKFTGTLWDIIAPLEYLEYISIPKRWISILSQVPLGMEVRRVTNDLITLDLLFRLKAYASIHLEE
jgi:hypothetical protein